MGFGIMFFGYFMTTMVSIPIAGLLPINLSGVVKLLGYILIIISAKKLSEYNSNFKTLMASSALMAIISFAESVVDITVFLSDNQIAVLPFSNALAVVNERKILDYIAFGGVIIFVATLCVAIKQLAEDIGIKKIVISATRNFVFYCIFFLVQAVSFMPFNWVATYRPVFVAALLIIELLCWILNLYMIFSCYAKICDSGDIGMEKRPSRFVFSKKKREDKEDE